jgi:hypothetical protein
MDNGHATRGTAREPATAMADRDAGIFQRQHEARASGNVNDLLIYRQLRHNHLRGDDYGGVLPHIERTAGEATAAAVTASRVPSYAAAFRHH